ncbi:Uncharacterized protein FWK35_00037932 [Aphis craccivora]|uniref:Uncharacterized protein n=1 Tax=Aphis craccivora TaxID=307492 RepID=A0A6G0XZN8_APHCR|nr:Uncharacterized protein FWK35_00037932 [Aphis craccivora]
MLLKHPSRSGGGGKKGTYIHSNNTSEIEIMSRSVKRDGYRVCLALRNVGHVHNKRFRLEFCRTPVSRDGSARRCKYIL